MGQPGGGESQTKRVFLTRKCPRTFDRTFSNKGSPAMFFFLTLQAPYPFSLVYIFHFRYELVNRSYIFSRDGEIYIYTFFFLSPFFISFYSYAIVTSSPPRQQHLATPTTTIPPKKKEKKKCNLLSLITDKKSIISHHALPVS